MNVMNKFFTKMNLLLGSVRSSREHQNFIQSSYLDKLIAYKEIAFSNSLNYFNLSSDKS